jgi:hypothetical protein
MVGVDRMCHDFGGKGITDNYRVEEFSFQKAVRNRVPKLFIMYKKIDVRWSDIAVAKVQMN